MLDQALNISVAVILTGSLGVIVHVVKTGLLRSNLQHYKEQVRLTSEDYSRLAKDYGDMAQAYAAERAGRQDAEQAHTDLADKHNTLLEKAYIRDGARFVRVVK